jgi:DNA-binding beta-propeller fold protein YncE
MGVLAFLAHLVQRARFVRGLIIASTPATAEFAGVLGQCRREIGVRLKADMRISETIPSPAVCGFVRPTVVIPATLVDKLSPEGLKAILIHELAHIKRGDLWVNSIQTFLQVVYFYNPFVWFANSVIRRVCEEAVDETVLVTLGGTAADYSNTLIDIGETAFWKADLGLRLIGVAESKKALQWRIRHMLTRPIPKTSKLGFLGVATVTCIAAILLPMSKAEKLRPVAETVETDVAPTFVKMWPKVPASWYFYNPCAPAMDSAGNIYVAETSNSRIQKFTSDGKFITKWGSKGSGNGEFKTPTIIALDASGNVYVTDSGNHRIQKFTSDGKFITKWGSEGSGEGQFKTPCGVAVDNSGNVYVSELSNHRVQKFTSDGKFITKWGSSGSGEGEFNRPLSVRIQKFTRDGSFIATWGRQGTDDGHFRYRGMSLDNSDRIYLVDRARIQVFTSDGGFITKWGSKGSDEGQFGYPWGMAVDASGNVYVADNGNHCIQKFTSDGKFITKWGSEGSGDGEFKGPSDVAVDRAGNVYVLEGPNARIQKFTSDGKFIAKWGSKGSGEGEFNRSTGVAVDRSGNVYVADSLNYRIQKFTSDGHSIVKWGSQGSDEGQFSNYLRVAVDDSGNVYVADIENNRIQKFQASR